MKKDNLIIAKKKFKSRLIVGTGKYKTMSECAKAIKLSGAEIVTVAVRRVNISDKNKPLLMDYIDPKKITYLPNTAGCFNSKEALRTLRLAREIGGWNLVKLEVLGDKKNLFPEMIETLKSTEILSKILTLLTATVTISAPESLIAFAHSDILLYFPVPTINLELNFLFAIIRLSFFKLTTSNKMNYFNFIIFI